MSDAWQPIAPFSVVQERGAFAARIGELHIGLFFIQGEMYAIDNLCTHGNACLTEGIIEGHLVECPLHAGLVDVRSGKAAGAPITRDSRIYPVKVETGQVFVRIPSAAMAAETGRP